MSGEILLEMRGGAPDKRRWNFVVDGGPNNPQNFYIRQLNDETSGGPIPFIIDGTNNNIILGAEKGNVGIGSTNPSQRLHVQGKIFSHGNVGPSDRRLKENIEPLENSLDKVSSLNGVHFEWKDKTRGTKRNSALLHRMLRRYFPSLCTPILRDLRLWNMQN